MKKYFFLLFFAGTRLLFAQNTFQCTVLDSVEKKPLEGATLQIEKTDLGGYSDETGTATISNIPNGTQTLSISYVGYLDKKITLLFPLEKTGQPLIIYLKPSGENTEDVVISSTRTNSRIEDQAQMVEVLGQEDMEEESTIVPGNVSSILGDLAVITIQRTNPVTGNDAVRMQGLDPQYTQIMRDGIPLYGGFSGSLGVLSIAPLDLKQVEIIKGSASTLYGGGAIAGLINLISKTPTDSPQATILLNVSTLKETNGNFFLSGKKGKWGGTLFGGANWKQAVDVNKDGFSEIPEDHNLSIHPRLFYTFSPKSQLIIGLTSTLNGRRSGDMQVIKGKADTNHVFMQALNTLRNVVEVQYHHDFSPKNSLEVKSAINSFWRDEKYYNYGFFFGGNILSSYSEISDRINAGRHTIVLGTNLVTESFRMARGLDPVLLSNYDYVTLGAFVQDDWKITDKLLIQTGLRYDYHNIKHHFVLPRIAFFYKPISNLSIRLAGGTGYKVPNVFTLSDPSATLLNNISDVKSERSLGANADINYRALIGEDMVLTFNQAFYATHIQNPIILSQNSLGQQLLKGADYYTISYGTDSYVSLSVKNIGIYVGYNHTEALQKRASVINPINSPVPFNPKDKLSGTLSYEITGKWRMGVEYSYVANQYVANARKVPSYGFIAAMIERKFKYGSLVLNGENLLDARQSKIEPLVTGTTKAPVFTPIWGYVEGRVINLSLKILIK